MHHNSNLLTTQAFGEISDFACPDEDRFWPGYSFGGDDKAFFIALNRQGAINELEPNESIVGPRGNYGRELL